MKKNEERKTERSKKKRERKKEQRKEKKKEKKEKKRKKEENFLVQSNLSVCYYCTSVILPLPLIKVVRRPHVAGVLLLQILNALMDALQSRR